MGNCSYSPATTYSLNSLSSLEKGGSQTSENACYKSGSSAEDDLFEKGIIPDNGEFAYSSSDGDCYYCTSDLYPTEAKSGTTCFSSNSTDSNAVSCKAFSTMGTKVSFTRTKYSGSKINCCFTGSDTDGEYTCDPAYRGGMESSNCKSALTTFCSDPSNFGNSDYTDYCKDFCKIERNAGKSTCDNLIKDYCDTDTGKNDASCDCINTYQDAIDFASDNSLVGDPVCYYSACWSSNDPLLTSAEASTRENCPPICNNVVGSVSANSASGVSYSVNQSCDVGGGTPIDVNDTSKTYNTKSFIQYFTDLTDTSGGLEAWFLRNWMMITIFLVFLIGSGITLGFLLG